MSDDDGAVDGPPPVDGLADVAERLYALPLDEFTPERDSAAKELRGERRRDLAAAVKALAKPTTAAWAVNVLVRRRRDEIEELLDLGQEMRAAQLALDGEALRHLGRAQHAALRSVRAALPDAVGRSLTEAVVHEVEDTLRAAMADEAAADAVRGGTLTKALEPAGFGPVDLTGATAVRVGAAATRGRRRGAGADRARSTARDVDTDPPLVDAAAAQAEVAAARDAATAAADELTRAEAAEREAGARHDALDAQVAALDAEVAELEAQLRDARDQLAQASEDRRRATSERSAAEKKAMAAERALTAAQRDAEQRGT